jgi:hypothetical protein
MGTVINLKVSGGEFDLRPRSFSADRRCLRWTPSEAARAWWEMTLIKSTLETMCELAQHALTEAAKSPNLTDSALDAAFGELKAVAEQVGEVCHDEVHRLLQGHVEALSFDLEVSDPHHIKVRARSPEVPAIHPVFGDLHLGSRDMAMVALRLIEASVKRFSDAISSLSVTIGVEGIARSTQQEAQFAADTAALTRLQILQQSDEALRSQAGSLPRRVYGLLNPQ